MVEPAPWNRRPGEPDQEWAAFELYLAAGPGRSLEGVAVQLGLSTALIRRWAGRWRWAERAAAWDAHQGASYSAEQRRAIREMAERQIKEATLLQQRALQRLRTLDPAELSPTDAARLLLEGARLEREARKLLREL